MLQSLLAAVLLSCLGAGVGAPPAADPAIVELYPDPQATDDPGEFVTVEFPAGANASAYALADRHGEVSLRVNRTAFTERTRLTFSTDPPRTRRLTNRTVVSLPDRIRLANTGDRVRLLRDGETIDTVEYDRTTEGHVYDAACEEWQPLGATDRPVVNTTGGTVEAFVLPDAPERGVNALESAEQRIYLAGYTLSSQRVVETLLDAHRAGVTVEVLVDGSPVGGMSTRTESALETLERGGIDVRVTAGEYGRYRFHHAKYAVVDERALVTSENWKPSGIGGRSSRGWGVITHQRAIVDGLVETFRADAGWVDAIPWSEYDVTPVETERASGSYPANFEAESFSVEQTELLVAPDNAERRIRTAIQNAENSLEIKQVQIGDERFPFLRETIAAAERGVEVRILLSGTWYAREENERLKTWLDEQASAGDLPLEVRIADPAGAFEKIHAKGLIVDGRQTLVGSINWNNNSVRRNREVALLIESEAVAAYFQAVFEADWGSDDERDLPLGFALAAVFVVALAVLGATRLEFDA